MAQVDQHRSFKRSAAELDAVFSFIETALGGATLSARDQYAVNIAAEELFTNCVKHNLGGGSITMRLIVSDLTLRLAVIDRDDEEFDPSSASVPTVKAGIEDRAPGGLGLHLVRSLFDSLEHHHQDDVLEIIATKTLERALSLPGSRTEHS